MYVDNFAAHDSTIALEAALRAIRTQLHRFPKICRHLIQPLNQIVLRYFKALFRKKWNRKRAEEGLNEI